MSTDAENKRLTAAIVESIAHMSEGRLPRRRRHLGWVLFTIVMWAAVAASTVAAVVMRVSA